MGNGTRTGSRPSSVKPLWQCPRCGHRFINKNLWHSCGRYKIADHFKGKSGTLRQTFRKYVDVARKCGPTTVYAQKIRIVLQHRVRFAGIVVRRGSLDTHIWLKRRVDHPLLTRTEVLGNRNFALHFRLSQPGDIDRRISGFLKEAYFIHQEGAPRFARRTQRQERRWPR